MTEQMVALIVAQTISFCSYSPDPDAVRGMLNNIYIPTMGTTHYIARSICKQLSNPYPTTYTLEAPTCRRVNNVCIAGRWVR